MNRDQLNKIVLQTQAEMDRLLNVKGGEYANSLDVLANFKRGAELVGLQPLQVLFVYLSKHYDGVASYVRKTAAGEQPVLSEPIEGRLDDIIVYCTLAKALIQEAKSQIVLSGDSDQHGSGFPGLSVAGAVRAAAVGVSSLRW